MRNLPETFDAPTVAAIDGLLDSVATENRVSIPLAIESGSRAWGFPSPDSDYDCRFVYVRTPDQYLSPWTPRDVIETPLVGDLDVNGWDLGKALKLMLKGNAVIIEWLRSPIVYRGDPVFRDEFLELAERCTERSLIARHYLHLGERQRNTYFGDGKDVAIKKLFYALRPAAALRWMRLRPGGLLPPMDFPTLMAECDPPASVRVIIDDLLALKGQTRELGSGPLPEPIRQFTDDEFEVTRQNLRSGDPAITAAARAIVDEFFKRWVERLVFTP